VRAAPWIAVYVAVLIAWLAFLASRKTPTLWKGRALAVVNGVFVLVAVATALVRGEIPDAQMVTFLAILVVVSVAAHNVWLLLHTDRAEAERILEKCFVQTRATHERTTTGYNVKLSEAEMRVRLTNAQFTQKLSFAGAGTSKKAELIRALIGKQFTQGYPILKIRTYYVTRRIPDPPPAG
jgi:hypothetical protein